TLEGNRWKILASVRSCGKQRVPCNVPDKFITTSGRKFDSIAAYTASIDKDAPIPLSLFCFIKIRHAAILASYEFLHRRHQQDWKRSSRFATSPKQRLN